jgi:epoxyqueuosine reductase QueG
MPVVNAMQTPDPEQILRRLYDADAEKFLDDPPDVPMFDPPIVAVARADDPWFPRLKEIIGDFLWTPQEALALAVPGATARSVICWALPVCEVARAANRAESRLPARPWVYVRVFGEEFITRLRLGLVERLQQMGFAAVAPQESPQNKVERRDGIGWSCNWSARHTAFVAGLGTFGISGGLITRRGIAHRLGSVVTDADIPATARPYGDDPFAWCLKTSRGTCGACIRRCPAGSIGETVADRIKDACRDWAYSVVRVEGRDRYHMDSVRGCGLCQTAVPCEARNPTEDNRE